MFPRSSEELADYEQRLTRPRFGPGRRLTVEFEMDREQYLALLPPPMEAVEGSVAVVGIGEWSSNCVGAYNGGSISLIASYGGVVGGVALNMWMDSEPAVQFGRDVLGEPKKIAKTGFELTGQGVEAWIERGGVRIVELRAELGAELGASQADRFSYNFRSRQSVDGFNLTDPVTLTRTTFSTDVTSRRRGSGTMTLRSTAHDPLGRIKVVRLLSAEYQEHDIIANTQAVGTISAEEYLPFHYGKQDEITSL